VVGGACKEMRNAYKILVGRHEGKKPLGRTRRIWEDTIKMDLKGIGWEALDWMYIYSSEYGPV
jgi:hypothetical protein